MSTADTYSDDLRLAHMLADSVDAYTMKKFKDMDYVVDTKPDLTPVTDADRQAEELIRSQLARSRGRDAIVGEEFGRTGSSSREWIIDPIDGTKNFIRQVPVWATLIALRDDQEIVVGLVSAPALGRRWWAVKDGGAYTGRSLSNATRMHVSKVSQLCDASLSYSDLNEWRAHEKLSQFLGLSEEVWRTRAYGDFWSYCLVAEGAVDIACEPELELYDMAALVPIVTEAGGRFTDLEGNPGPFGPNALASNSLLHDQVVSALGDTQDRLFPS